MKELVTNAMDDLLCAPLPERPDNGFSTMVMLKAAQAQDRKSAFTWMAVTLGVLVGMAFLPWQGVLEIAIRDYTALLLQPGLYLAAIVLAIALLIDRQDVRI